MRNYLRNYDYTVQTFQEAIDLVRMLNREFPRTINSERRVGLYVEIKCDDWYARYNGMDPAAVIFKTLKDNGLETIDKSKNDIPIVIQSFHLSSLEDWAVRFSESDLPRVLVFGTYGGNVFQTIY